MLISIFFVSRSLLFVYKFDNIYVNLLSSRVILRLKAREAKFLVSTEVFLLVIYLSSISLQYLYIKLAGIALLLLQFMALKIGNITEDLDWNYILEYLTTRDLIKFRY